MAFSKILIANRGEIAVRVVRTARALGYRTVAVYSEADADQLHVRAADEAVCIGPPAPSQSYLDIEKVLDAAEQTGADAIHPGYGFLSENGAFAAACAQRGITFIGPPVQAIEVMGSKRASKLKVMEADVPCVPGYEGADQDDETLVAEAKRIGLPIMIKASAGGGGRGMRLCASEGDLSDMIRAARSEATSAFGSGELILEKAVIEPRHVEIQVFADTHGNCIHLGERDCSVQRRHQKVIEESPSPVMTPELRERMGTAAVAAAQAVGYVGAGTVEFLVDKDLNFYFLEMNTRLQVEHPVTEMVTGTDLVAWQIKVAAGDPLPMAQNEVALHGHAIEARLYAEDPTQNFMPQTGPVLMWRLPQGIDVRVDYAVREGAAITPHYDPMVAKVIAHGQTRDEARQKLAAALDEIALLGVVHNKRFLAQVVRHPVFAAGGATTAFIDAHMSEDATLVDAGPSDEDWALGAALWLLRHSGQTDMSWIGWRSASQIDAVLKLESGDFKIQASLRALGRGLRGHRFGVTLGADFDDEAPRTVTVEVVDRAPGELLYAIDGRRQRAQYAVHDGQLFLHRAGTDRIIADVTQRPPAVAGAAGSGVLMAPMDGAVIGVLAEVGAEVAPGQTLVVIEAMKMEHPVKADVAGTLQELNVKVGDQVKPRQVVAVIARADDGENGDA